jgi:hypothetical protein
MENGQVKGRAAAVMLVGNTDTQFTAEAPPVAYVKPASTQSNPNQGAKEALRGVAARAAGPPKNAASMTTLLHVKGGDARENPPGERSEQVDAMRVVRALAEAS